MHETTRSSSHFKEDVVLTLFTPRSRPVSVRISMCMVLDEACPKEIRSLKSELRASNSKMFSELSPTCALNPTEQTFSEIVADHCVKLRPLWCGF